MSGHPYFDAWLTAPDAATSITLARSSGRTVLSGADMRDRCRRVAAALSGARVGPGEVVLIFLSHQPMLIPAFFGTQLAGAVPAYMPPLSPRQDRAAYLASHAELIAHVRPTAIIADPEVAALLPAPDGVTVLTVADLEAASSDAAPVPAWDPNAVCLLQHSSGTTGLKKGVQLSYGAGGIL